MINKPKTIYFIAFWFLIVQLLSIARSVRTIQTALSLGIQIPILTYLYLGINVVLFKYISSGLIELKKAPIWIYILFFSFRSLIGIYRIIFTELPSTRSFVLVLVIVVINIITILYLIRPSFQRLCTEFRQEPNRDLVEYIPVDKSPSGRLRNRIYWFVAILLCFLILIFFQIR